MTSSSDSNSGTSKFTAHAAEILRSSTEFPYLGDADRPLLNVSQECYEQIKHVIQKTYPKCDIFKIQHVSAPEMYGMYLLHKEEMRLANGGNDVKERTLFHVTSEENATESLIHGLDWRRNQFLEFGAGVSFSNSAAYSNYYADQSTNKVGVRVIILSSMLMNVKYLVDQKLFPEINLIIPPDTADTAVDRNENVFVKYNDFESYPFFFVYYRWAPKQLNECKYFIDVLQTLKAEENGLCQEMANVCLNPESRGRHEISRLQNSSKQHLAVDKAEAEAEGAAALLKFPNKNTRKRRFTVDKAENEAGNLPKCQNKDARKQPYRNRQSGSGSSRLSETPESDVASAYAAATLLKSQKDAEKRSLAVNKVEAEAEGAALLKFPNKNTRKRRQPMPEPKSSL